MIGEHKFDEAFILKTMFLVFPAYGIKVNDLNNPETNTSVQFYPTAEYSKVTNPQEKTKTCGLLLFVNKHHKYT